MSRRDAEHHGVLLVDKPSGMTSHDVVQRLRRIARTSRVGHAGTLDPMATGVLVVMVGEATKLGPYLTAEEKRYRAELQLGRSTDTLDAEGATTAEAPLPGWWSSDERAAKVEQALAEERARALQAPPIFSAIKIDGESAHALARRGEIPELAPRPVAVASLASLATTDPGTIELELEVSKGYYVRSLARDLGVALGCPAHLTALRRLASGRFRIEDTSPLGAFLEAPGRWLERLLDVPTAASLAMPLGRLTPEGTLRARQGKRLHDGDFVEPPAGTGAAGWLAPEGTLVAVGRRDEEAHVVLRGFR
ncbi:MAG: tRNA pseudouridine(55) synthase TruB [Deltaproteobacteria bacterium]|nr:tRNA pseudouridine(55) synthase TruB [Deltaproteobacteria bacterium]